MKITVFGEVLWDIFGEEKKIGGAPFNFAAHASRLGADVSLVSAVGKDELGDEAIEALRKLNVPDGSVARIEAPTGFCRVTLHDGTPSYDLVQPVAYDAIPVPEKSAFHADAFYFGSLAQRSDASRRTLEALLQGDFGEVFFDINIRQHYYSAERIDSSLRHTTIFKISREEIGVLGIVGTPVQICEKVAEKYPNLKLILVTLDKDGSLAYSCGDKRVYDSPKPSTHAVSTVGAGDSFSACFLYNFLAGESVEDCLRYATALSGYVVTQLGAVPDYPADLCVKRN